MMYSPMLYEMAMARIREEHEKAAMARLAAASRNGETQLAGLRKRLERYRLSWQIGRALLEGSEGWLRRAWSVATGPVDAARAK